MKTIMVVDDDVDIRESTKKLLESKGFKVITAINGDDCLKRLKTTTPDLILMDILMPGTPVNKILSQIKKIKIIMFSVVSLSEGDIAESGDKIPSTKKYPNVVDYIEKPVDLKEMMDKINETLGS